jgi:predicted CopG family antitoxin
MSTSIRVSEQTKEKLDRLKRDSESFDELLDRLTNDEQPIEIGAWDSETADRAREAIDRSRESFESRESSSEETKQVARDVARQEINDFISDATSNRSSVSNIRAQPGTNRPDPNQQKADRKLEPFFDGRAMKAQQWVAAEQERLSRASHDDDPLPPEQFWDEFGSKIWSTLSRAEFVNLTTEGLE